MEEATLLQQIQEARTINWMEEVFFSTIVTRTGSIVLKRMLKFCRPNNRNSSFNDVDFERRGTKIGTMKPIRSTKLSLPAHLRRMVDDRCRE